MSTKLLLPLLGGIAIAAVVGIVGRKAESPSSQLVEAVRLPQVRDKSGVSLEESLLARRSVRNYAKAPLTLAQVGQLLWAGQGITAAGRFRTAPSAGALYPLETCLVAGAVEGLAPGVYRYVPAGHNLVLRVAGDKRQELYEAALRQEAVRDAPAVLVFSAVYGRTTKKYGQRGVRYVHMEAGHAAQNICLQATALGLGTVTIGAFQDDAVKSSLGMPEEEPLYLLPIGRK